MIEVGLFDIGSMTSMAWKELPGRRFIPDADLAEIQRHAQQLTLRQIERIVLADEGTELSPNPAQVQTAAAALTERIRLGQIANIVSWHHPVRLAEQVAILDVISGGRTEVGLGRGYQPRDTETFGATYGSSHQGQERDRSYDDEACQILVKAWTQDSFSHRNPNRYFNFDAAPGELPIGLLDVPVTMRELSVLPQPLQKPHPPLWESIISPRSVAYAARHGFNGYFMMATVDQLREATELYYAEAEKAGWPDMLDPELTPELLEESGLLVIGSRQEVLERLIELKEEVFRDGDAMLSLWMEPGCWSDEAVREQTQLVAEDILPELRRACGGGPERVPVLATDEEG